MTAPTFRFAPPEVPVTPAFRWVLARAYATGDTALAETEGDAAVALAQSLSVAARIASVQPQTRLAGELGPQGAAEMKRQRALAVAQEMRLGTALVAVDGVAADLRTPYAPLKGQALVLGGFAPDGGRPSSDLDLLVPEAKLENLQKELLRQGFTLAGEAYEHQAAALRHADGGQVELHRVLPGVRLEAKRSATFESLVAAGLLGPPPGAMSFRPRGDLRLPRRELLTAHALVHAIAQHGLAPQVFPGFLFFGDLVDLAFRGSGGRATLAAIVPWIESEVSYEEAAAALDLATALAAGEEALLCEVGPGRSHARLLLDHFHAGVTDPRYVTSLKSRLLERPLSDKPQAVAKAELLARTLAPRAGESILARIRFLFRRFWTVRAAGRK
ncbi:MAG: nucleotidyltransferase family protein [Thermoanaerobaculia bacterium]